MAVGFPYPRFRESRTYPVGEGELRTAVGAALEQLGWPAKILWGQDFQARVPTTNWSWHHDFKVRILPGGVVDAESKSAYQDMFIDLGRNKRNVEKFFAQMEQTTGRPQGSDSLAR
jgi:hypothetical protein